MKIYRLTINEENCSFSENQLDVMIEDIKTIPVGEEAKIEVIEMSEEEFESLPEFEGY